MQRAHFISHHQRRAIRLANTPISFHSSLTTIYTRHTVASGDVPPDLIPHTDSHPQMDERERNESEKTSSPGRQHTNKKSVRRKTHLFTLSFIRNSTAWQARIVVASSSSFKGGGAHWCGVNLHYRRCRERRLRRGGVYLLN